jgi:DNA-binding beta-propeller fold protein YncE
VGIGPGGDVWVSDRELNHLQRFSALGQLLAVVGTTGDGPGQFLSPEGVAVDQRGNVYVADVVNRRIQKLAPDGFFLEEFGRGVLKQPTYVAVDRSCRVYVSDYRRVVVFQSAAGC